VIDKSYNTANPLLFLIFNRPDTTRQVFDAIRRAKPKKLYIAADGPRLNRPDDTKLCEEARRLATNVDWDCQIETLFREVNKGCAIAVSEAITWFFKNEPEGIILEDDCLPDNSFFRFCDELLERFRHDQRVAIISGNNFQRYPPRDKSSYYFSLFNHIWGWASWQRAWSFYDHQMSAWPEIRNQDWLMDLLGCRKYAAYWKNAFNRTYCGEIDTWDYRWTFFCWREGMVSILPSINLVRNIGFGDTATHTRGSHESGRSSGLRTMTFPLQHPAHRIVDRQADLYTMKTHFQQKPLPLRVASRMKQVFFNMGKRIVW